MQNFLEAGRVVECARWDNRLPACCRKVIEGVHMMAVLRWVCAVWRGKGRGEVVRGYGAGERPVYQVDLRCSDARRHQGEIEPYLMMSGVTVRHKNDGRVSFTRFFS